jgi:hypothetical protein
MKKTAPKGLITSEVIEAYLANDKNGIRTARQLGISIGTLHHHLRKATGLKTTGKIGATKATRAPKLKKGEVRRYIVTAAQNNTDVIEPLWKNIHALAKFYDAEVIVGTFTYNRNTSQDRPEKGKRWQEYQDSVWFDPRLEPFTVDARRELAPGLIWVGDANIIPTAANPLSGFETLTGIDSAIFPASKIRMDSIPTGKTEPTKQNWSTGTVTKRNYIAKKAGQKAEFHHTYGGLVVEVDHEGDWFVRPLDADGKWRIQDLDVVVDNEVVTTGNPVESLTPGDIHWDVIDKTVAEVFWGEGGVLDTLHPKFQFMHDILDQRSRNHHDMGNHHKMFAKWARGMECLKSEVQRVAEFTHWADRKWCKMVVVDSNHDRALSRWLLEADFRRDPVNAQYYLKAQSAMYDALAKGDSNFHLLEWALTDAGCAKGIKFLRPDESFLTCPKGSGRGIEHGMHGDLGPNGARGGVRNFARLGRKVTRAHEHSPSIYDGVHTVGTFTQMDVGYNVGPSSWSHTFGIDYASGKRSMVTIRNGKWRIPLNSAKVSEPLPVKRKG